MQLLCRKFEINYRLYTVRALRSLSQQLIKIMDPAFRLFLGVLISYPIMGVYRKLVRRMSLHGHHLYFLTTGLCTSYFVLGLDGPLHGLLAGTMTWMVLRGMGATTLSTAVVFILQLVHLSVINAATLNNENLVSKHILWDSGILHH